MKHGEKNVMLGILGHVCVLHQRFDEQTKKWELLTDRRFCRWGVLQWKSY